MSVSRMQAIIAVHGNPQCMPVVRSLETGLRMRGAAFCDSIVVNLLRGSCIEMIQLNLDRDTGVDVGPEILKTSL